MKRRRYFMYMFKCLAVCWSTKCMLFNQYIGYFKNTPLKKSALPVKPPKWFVQTIWLALLLRTSSWHDDKVQNFRTKCAGCNRQLLRICICIEPNWLPFNMSYLLFIVTVNGQCHTQMQAYWNRADQNIQYSICSGILKLPSWL